MLGQAAHVFLSLLPCELLINEKELRRNQGLFHLLDFSCIYDHHLIFYSFSVKGCLNHTIPVISMEMHTWKVSFSSDLR